MELKCINSDSTGNCFVIRDGFGKMLLLDAGVPINKIKHAIDFNISDLDGAVITHEHKDHSRAVDDISMMGVELFTPYKSEQARQRMELGNYVVTAFLHSDNDGNPLHSNSDNTPCRCFGMFITHKKIKGWNLLYVTDTEYCKYTFPNLVNLIIGTNYDSELVKDAEGNRFYHVVSGHMSIDTACDMIEANNPSGNVILSHLSKQHADAHVFQLRAMARCSCPVYIADRGLVINNL